MKRKYLNNQTNSYIYDFQQHDAIRSFSDDIFTGKVNIDEAEMDHANLLENLKELSEKSKPRTKKKKKKQR